MGRLQLDILSPVVVRFVGDFHSPFVSEDVPRLIGPVRQPIVQPDRLDAQVREVALFRSLLDSVVIQINPDQERSIDLVAEIDLAIAIAAIFQECRRRRAPDSRSGEKTEVVA